MPAGLAGAFTACSEAAPAAHRTRAAEQLDWAAAEYRAHHLMAACNSEKGAGGSLAATKTIAMRGADGRFALTGEKILATGGTNAAWFFSTAKVAPEEMPGCGVVEFFFVPVQGAGVEVADDWDGFGMRSTESQTVRYSGAVAESILGFPDVIDRRASRPATGTCSSPRSRSAAPGRSSMRCRTRLRQAPQCASAWPMR